MNKFNTGAMALALGFAFSTTVVAQAMSRHDYQAGKDRIATEYKSDKAGCLALSGNASDVCNLQARGKEKVAIATLEAAYKPTVQNHYEVRVAKAEADYAVARERCDDLSGNPKDVCVKEAQAAETAAKADAKVQMKTAEAAATAGEKSSDARRDASSDKRDADYAVAKEKCDTFAGSAKDSCIDQAKVRFGKS
jgi:hypothetical protein